MKPDWFIWDYTIGIIVNIALYLAFAISVLGYWRNKGGWKWYFFLFYPITMLIDFVLIVISIYSGLRGNPIIWKTRTYSTKPNSSQSES